MKTLVPALLICGAAFAQPYPIFSQAQVYQPLAGGTSLIGQGSLTQTVDDGQAIVPIGFSFPYYGQNFTQVLVHSNGFISFDIAQCGTNSICNDGTKIPNAARGSGVAHNVIAPWWDDMRFDATTTVKTRSSATEFEVEWLSLKPYSSTVGAFALNMRIKLTASGLFQIAYGTNGSGTGGTATVGFENGSGSLGDSLPLPPSMMACSLTAAACSMTSWPTDTLFTIGQPVQPDLIVETVNLQSIVKMGTNLTLTVNPTFRNFGMNPANGFLWRAYLSTDRTWDASDALILTSTTPLNASANSTVSDTASGTIVAPAPGNYYVIVQADSALQITEASEANNYGATATPFVQGLDLVATAITGPTNTGPGNVIAVNARWLNQGIDPAGNVEFEVRLSADTLFSTSDFVLSTSTRMVAGGQTVDDMLMITVPSNVPAGDFYYVLRVNSSTTMPIVEASTTNNIVFSSGKVTVRQADLVAGVVDYVDPVTHLTTRQGLFGQAGSIRIAASNTGGADARAFKIGVVISSDNSLGLLTDTIITEPIYGPLAAGANAVYDVSFTLPMVDRAGVPFQTGNYYIWVLLDSTGDITEINDFNNNVMVATPVRINAPAPDLTVATMFAPASAGVGEVMPVRRTLRNIGVRDATAHYKYYFSANNEVSEVDTPAKVVSANGTLSEFGTVALMPMQGVLEDELIEVPPGLQPGNYYVGCIIDFDQQIAELDETNNGRVSSIVSVVPSSLRVLTVAPPDAVVERPYSFMLAAAGEVAGMASMWSVLPGSGTLPEGLTLSSAGLITGTPKAQTVTSFTVKLENNSRTAVGRIAMRVVPSSSGLEITSTYLPPIINDVSVRYEYPLAAAGGSKPYKWATVGAMPTNLQNLTLSADGVVSGFLRANAAETASPVTFQVTDSLGVKATKTLTMRVVAAGGLFFSVMSVPDGLVGTNYTTDLAVHNGDMSALSRPLAYSVADGALPPGVAIETAQDIALLSGTPTQAGAFTFSIQAVDGKGRVAVIDLMMRVHTKRLTVRAAELPTVMRPGETSLFGFSADGSGATTFELFSGALPPGLTLDGASGKVNGTVDLDKSEGTYNFVIGAADSAGATGIGPFTVNVQRAPPKTGCSAAGLELFGVLALATLVRARRRSAR